ncbi:MAG: hypothetical protein LJE67_07590 [Salaquimonas sp.]|nr:hypothetical protein [Salaquimonas sp.]
MSDTSGQRKVLHPDPDDERRGSQRHRVLKSGLAAYNKHYSTLPCVMRNESETGARLNFDDLASVPIAFTLHVGVDGYQVECERVWREGKACGVKFVSEKTPSRIFDAFRLSSTETALSKEMMRAMKLQEQSQDEGEGQPAVIEVRERQPKSNKPTFGRRS